MNITTLGIDLAKNIFQLHGVNQRGKTILQKKISRAKLADFIVQLPACTIYMEACAGADYWAKKFISFGHEVKLISPQYVKPFVKTNKNDAKDAEAIVEAGIRPNMRFVEIKTTEQQDIQSTHRIRERLMAQRTALVNQIRGLLMERGIFVQQGVQKLKRELPKIVESDELSASMKENVLELYKELNYLNSKIAFYDEKIEAIFKQNEACLRLEKMPGIGKLTATMLVAIIGNGSTFKNGRHFAAFSGLVPRQCSSGGKERLLGISKRGDTYLRKLLIHGARAVLRHVNKKKDKESLWLQTLAKRAGMNRAAVALANKMARRAWAMIHYGTEYQRGHVPSFKSICN